MASGGCLARVWFSFAAFMIAAIATGQTPTPFRPDIPTTWDEKALSDWATPLAGLNVPPSHISPKQYYSLPVDNLKTYPVYLAGREPDGYWEMLNRVGPKPMIEPGQLRGEADWIEAGRMVFQQMDHLHLRTQDPAFIQTVRRGESLVPLPDGTAANVRWVPTTNGVALGFPNCAGCHLLVMRDGTIVPGASTLGAPQKSTGPAGPAIVAKAQIAQRYVTGGAPLRMGPEPLGMWLYRAYGVPWNPNDIHAGLKTATVQEYDTLVAAQFRGGALPRWNGSPYYPTKIPDLIGIQDRKYIDHTATHLNRGVGDLMRYAALVSWAEATAFGAHQMLGEETELPKFRRSDQALYALAVYVQSLKPPANPNPVNEHAIAGEKIFRGEGCSGCHSPPLYTNNKLTLAQGFQPPKDRPATLSILPVSVGTDPGLALKTRKGTGYYKVPSLRGVWYRGHYLHDGSVASLEEMFDPDRLNDSHVPGGFTPLGVKTRAIQGHEFGLRLSPEQRVDLVAFLRTL